MGGDEYGQIILERGEFAFPEHQVGDVIFDFPFQFVKSFFGGGNDDIVGIDVKKRHENADINCRFGSGPGADAGGFHDNQFPVGKHTVVHEQYCHKQGYRRKNDKYAGHQQRGHFDEQNNRKPLIGNQFHKTQRLGQPDDGHQRERHQQKANHNLGYYIFV